MKQHLSKNRTKRGSDLNRAVNEHGKENFTMRIVVTAKDRKTILQAEIACIALLRAFGYSIYNKHSGGGNPPSSLGKKHTSETKKRMSVAQKGRIVSEETREKLRVIALNMSAEQKEKMSLAKVGLKQSPEQIEKRAATRRGKPSPIRTLTFETAEKIRAEYAVGGIFQKDLAVKYNTTKKGVQSITSGKAYRN